MLKVVACLNRFLYTIWTMKTSFLHPFEDQIVNCTNESFETVLADFIKFVQNSSVQGYSKRKIIMEVVRITNVAKLQQFYYNLLLKFEGQGVVQPLSAYHA